jgi:hypothetical protein
MLHQKPETTATAPQPVSADSHYKSLAESAVASIQSNLDRAEAQKLLANAGKWGWELTHKTISSFIEKRKHQRAMAGR